jgi:hypothetical protein
MNGLQRQLPVTLTRVMDEGKLDRPLVVASSRVPLDLGLLT